MDTQSAVGVCIGTNVAAHTHTHSRGCGKVQDGPHRHEFCFYI